MQNTTYFCMPIGYTHSPDKLLFSGFAPKFSVIARPVRTLVVAIPQLVGKCAENGQTP